MLFGKTLTLTDRNGTTHTYSYDTLGRQISDAVTMLASGVDGTGGVYMQRYIWSPVNVNALVLRDADTSGTGLAVTGTAYSRLWAVQDVNWNVVAPVNGIEVYENGVKIGEQKIDDHHIVGMAGNGKNAFSKNGKGPIEGPGPIDSFPPGQPFPPPILPPEVSLRPVFTTQVYLLPDPNGH